MFCSIFVCVLFPKKTTKKTYSLNLKTCLNIETDHRAPPIPVSPAHPALAADSLITTQ